MRGIFLRYVLRGMLVSTLGVGLVLLLVLFAYQFSFVLGRAADGQVPGSLVLKLVLLTLRSNLTVILPFAVVLGVVLGLGRLYHDSEMAAARACGIGTRTLLAAAALVIAPVAALAAWIAFDQGPAAASEVAQLRTDALRTATARGLTPGQFRSLGRGTTLYFGSVDADGTLRDVFLQRDLPLKDEPGGMQVVMATRARYAISVDSSYYAIEMQDGRSFEGRPGEGDWRVSRFGQQTWRVPIPQASLPGRPRLDALPTSELLLSRAAVLRAELHWRIGWVLAVIVLGLAAVPLARLRPGQMRHARVPWAVLLFAVYSGLLSTGRLMLERGDLPVAAGLWWVHAAVMAGVVVALNLPRVDAVLRRRAGAVDLTAR